ncbi:hypothetical protein SGRI78S_06512 [Streptomyces griseus subsp. griseus]
MRTLAITQNITVDGSIEMITDWFDPQGQPGVDMSDVLEESHRQDARADALLLGRRTFEDFRGYWPLQTDDPTGIAAYLDQVPKYVVSGTLTDPGWRNATVLTGDPVEEVRRLKAEEGGKDIVLTGSITLAHALIAAGAVDEYRLFVHPAVQGRGRRLFPDGYEPPAAAPGIEGVPQRDHPAAVRPGLTPPEESLTPAGPGAPGPGARAVTRPSGPATASCPRPTPGDRCGDPSPRRGGRRAASRAG